MSIPSCGPEPAYYHVYPKLGRTVSSEWWTWKMCQNEVTSRTTQQYAPVGGDPATESDKSYTTTAFDTNFFADNFLILSVIVILAVAAVILSVYLYRSRDVPVYQPEYDYDTVNLGDPTVGISGPAN